MQITNILLTLSIVVSVNYYVVAVSLQKELTLTLRQKQILDQFKSQVQSKLPYEFMKQDLNLVRYLRAQSFDLQRAEDMILKTVQWREENGINTINDEDWFEFELDYKYYLEGTDKLGRPIINFFAGEWDVRKGVVSGKEQKIIRYFWKCLEDASLQVREAQAQGKNVTQFVFLYDMNGYNLIQQGCPQCIPSIIQFLVTYENHYPGSMHKLNMVNTPGVFQLLLNVLRPLMSESTRDALQIYGTDKSQWRRALKNEISDENLLLDFGGNLPRPSY